MEAIERMIAHCYGHLQACQEDGDAGYTVTVSDGDVAAPGSLAPS